jgi:hypothetical protein
MLNNDMTGMRSLAPTPELGAQSADGMRKSPQMMAYITELLKRLAAGDRSVLAELKAMGIEEDMAMEMISSMQINQQGAGADVSSEMLAQTT